MNGDDTDGMRISRRDALKLTLAAGVTATSVTLAVTSPAEAAKAGVFLHGVASGDPRQSRVVIWTRVTKTNGGEAVPVKWTVAEDKKMRRIVKEGNASARPGRDFTVKVDVDGLEPGRTYFYQFKSSGDLSPVGRMRTLPKGEVKKLKLAVFSCSNFELGYFNAYAEAAKIDDLDAVLHLGDYIYEYGPGLGGYTTPATAAGLAPKPRDSELDPPQEIVLLDQYRARHALYRTDKHLQALHRDNAFINIWDDHEVANDAWTGGAENHQPATEGSWQARKRAGVRAFYEWLPIRDPEDGERIDPDTGNPDELYRSFDFGDLARIIMIDTREAARDEQLSTVGLVAAYTGAPAEGPFPHDVDGDGSVRTLIGPKQQKWFDKKIAETTQPWQIIGNQVLMFYQAAPDIVGSSVLTAEDKAKFIATIDQLFGAGAGQQFAQLGAAGLPSPLSADAWTGYPTARVAMLKSLSKASNPIVLTGDSHQAWTANLVLPNGSKSTPVAPEFGGTSVSSPGLEQYILTIPPEKTAAVLVETSAERPKADQLIYTDQSRRGFMLVEVTPKAATVDHVFVSTVFETTWTTETKRFRVPLGKKAASLAEV
ncbi:alkaline phosphatase D family protein [Chelatococcus sambhunathii]|uniref:Alkaline phosphatase D family protein n=1 Tax=Chelatococcus sambhunathii TaxID=363953 RepID=A0ABU1DK85_9HYPH|nr:alkaline phosphatase D family protein [Chelatococcus sambhunathii]MDR4308374.1 alkaline phosphatase D family protein [Chelatococcus sambhunathii]